MSLGRVLHRENSRVTNSNMFKLLEDCCWVLTSHVWGVISGALKGGRVVPELLMKVTWSWNQL